MLATFRTYRWLPGLTAALFLVSSALPLVMLACLHCFMPAEEASMHTEAGMHTEAMPCPEMNVVEAMPMLGDACDMALAATDCCTMHASAPAQKPRALAETAPRLLVLTAAFVSSGVPSIDLSPSVFLPPRKAILFVSSISISLLIGSLRN